MCCWFEFKHCVVRVAVLLSLVCVIGVFVYSMCCCVLLCCRFVGLSCFVSLLYR